MSDLVDTDHWIEYQNCPQVSTESFGLAATRPWSTLDSDTAEEVEVQHEEPAPSVWRPFIIDVSGPTILLGADTANENRILIYNSAIYLPNTCASCDGALDKSEQELKFIHPAFYCNNSQELDHQTLACQAPHCPLEFSNIKDLKTHSIKSNHVTLNCGIEGCNVALTASTVDIENHYDIQHPEVAHSICVKCESIFGFAGDLAHHCKNVGHAGFVCQFPDCGVECIYAKDLKRHQLIHKRKTISYSCTHCRNYRGNSGFKRKDHLVQHMRNYHRMEDYAPINGFCRECKCPLEYTSLDDLQKHMLEVHHSSPYVCREPNCDRVGMNGFENSKDLKAHSKNDHISPYQCTQSGCDRIGNKGWKRKRDMIKHLQKAHGVTVDAQNIM